MTSKVTYKKGELMCADYMSRHPVKDSPKHSYAEEHVRFVVTNSVPKALNLNHIATASKDDKTLQSVILSVKTNRWDRKCIAKDNAYSVYAKLSHELTVLDINDQENILPGTRLVIPHSLQNHVLDLAHAGHMGSVKTDTSATKGMVPLY